MMYSILVVLSVVFMQIAAAYGWYEVGKNKAKRKYLEQIRSLLHERNQHIFLDKVTAIIDSMNEEDNEFEKPSRIVQDRSAKRRGS